MKNQRMERQMEFINELGKHSKDALIGLLLKVRNYTRKDLLNLNKKELLARAIEYYNNENYFSEVLTFCNDKLYNRLKERQLTIDFKDMAPDIEDIKFLISNLILSNFEEVLAQIENCESNIKLEIYDNYKLSYERLDFDKIEKERNECKDIKECLKCCINLYGAVSLNEFLSIYRKYYTVVLNDDQIMDYFIRNTRITYEYNFFVNVIAIRELAMNEALLDKILYKLDRAHLYYPEKNIFVKYSDTTYFEKRRGIVNLKAYLVKNFNLNNQVDFVISKILLNHNCGYDIEDIVKSLRNMNIDFTSEKDFNFFFDLLEKALSANPVWVARGFSGKDLTFG